MPDQPGSYDFVYVHTDIPEGITIRDWRAQRAAERAARREQERAARRRRRLAPLTGRWRSHSHAPGPSVAAVLRTCVDRRAEAVLRRAIRGREYARSAVPQANVPIRTRVRSYDD